MGDRGVVRFSDNGLVNLDPASLRAPQGQYQMAQVAVAQPGIPVTQPGVVQGTVVQPGAPYPGAPHQGMYQPVTQPAAPMSSTQAYEEEEAPPSYTEVHQPGMPPTPPAAYGAPVQSPPGQGYGGQV